MSRKWTLGHTWLALNVRLRALMREKAGKRTPRIVAIVDSQRVESDPHGGEVGYDAGKKIKGRKRHVLMDPWPAAQSLSEKETQLSFAPQV